MSEKVLVTDDDQTLRMLMRELLETNLCAEVIEAPDGAEAWAKLEAGLAPSLCIFDVRMPKMGGLSLLAKLRGDPRFKQLKVMLCSTVNSRATIIEAAKLRVNAFLLKPFKADDFLAHVRALFKVAPANPNAFLDPVDAVLKRLGISLKLYLRLLAVLDGDIQSFVQSLLTSSDLTDEDFRFRVGGINGAISSLGVVGFADLFARLEKVESFRAPDSLILVKAIDEERLRLQVAMSELQQNAMKRP
jgi:CheY-like chemotaxis protein